MKRGAAARIVSRASCEGMPGGPARSRSARSGRASTSDWTEIDQEPDRSLPTYQLVGPPGSAGSERHSSAESAKITSATTADTTHHRQMAWMTNNSR